MFATSFSELVIFWLVVLPLAVYGFKKMGGWFDPKGEIKDAAKGGILDFIKRKLK